MAHPKSFFPIVILFFPNTLILRKMCDNIKKGFIFSWLYFQIIVNCKS